MNQFDFTGEPGTANFKSWNTYPDWADVSGVIVNGHRVTMFKIVDGPSAVEVASSFDTDKGSAEVAFRIEIPCGEHNGNIRTRRATVRGYIIYCVKMPMSSVYCKVGIHIATVADPGSFLADAVCTTYNPQEKTGMMTLSPAVISRLMKGVAELY